MPNATFKGFKQVSKAYFDSLRDEDKIGYLWFVRSNIETSGETATYTGEIFLGTRCYGHHGSEVEDLEYRLNAILYNAGIVDESGNTINLDLKYLTKEEAEEDSVNKVTLLNDDSTQGDPLGILIISGNDVNN